MILYMYLKYVVQSTKALLCTHINGTMELFSLLLMSPGQNLEDFNGYGLRKEQRLV